MGYGHQTLVTDTPLEEKFIEHLSEVSVTLLLHGYVILTYLRISSYRSAVIKFGEEIHFLEIEPLGTHPQVMMTSLP